MKVIYRMSGPEQVLSHLTGPTHSSRMRAMSMSDQFITTSVSKQEEWRPVVGFEGHYSVSNLGRVRRDLGGQGARAGYILRATINSGNGYFRVGLVVYGRQVTFLIHRLVAEAFLGPRPESMTVNHIDGNKLNNSPDNLEYISLSDNTKHQWATGLVKPEDMAKRLTREEVIRIRELLATGISQREVGRRTGVNQGTISDIANKRTWRHLP